MSINNELEEAIRQAVKEAEQPSFVANRLIAWLNNMGETNSDEEKIDYLESLLDSVNVSKEC